MQNVLLCGNGTLKIYGSCKSDLESRQATRDIYTNISFLRQRAEKSAIRVQNTWFFTTGKEIYEGRTPKDDVTKQFATTIFSATQRCNVGTIRNNVATMLQCCVALKIVVANRVV